MSTPEYIPGTCNIGPAEIKARRKTAVFSSILGAAIIIFMLLIHAEKPWRLLLFFPAISVGIGFQQVYYKFCVGFGLKGIFNFGNIGKTYTVEQKEYFKKDREKAWKVIIRGLLFGFLLAVLFYILPV